MLLYSCFFSLLFVAYSNRRNSHNGTRDGILEADVGWSIIGSDGTMYHTAALLSENRSAAISSVRQESDVEYNNNYIMQHHASNATLSGRTGHDLPSLGIALGASIVVCIILNLLFSGSLGVSSNSSSAMDAEPSEQQSVNDDVPMALTILRSSGEVLATVDAGSRWYGDALQRAVSVHLAPHEHLHSIVYQSKACDRRINDYCRLGEVGIEDGSKLRVICLSSYALPSGVSLFFFKKRMAGPMGALKLAHLWVHDSCAWLECGEMLDVGHSSLKYMQGCVDEKACLRLQDNDEEEIEGIIEEEYGRQRIVGLHLPVLGDVDLQQAVPDAVFDVSQIPGFVGWISLFDGVAEMVVKIGKSRVEMECTPDQAVHLRFGVCSVPSNDESQEMTFLDEQDFGNWKLVLPSDATPKGSTPSGILCGLVGQRHLALQGFPLLGSVELIEYAFWNDMSAPFHLEV